jgi:hypothetical protein
VVLDVNSGGRALVPGLPSSEGEGNMAIANVKVRILKSCYVGKQVRKIGDVVTVPEPQARELCWMRKAELVIDKPAAPPLEPPKKREGKE